MAAQKVDYLITVVLSAFLITGCGGSSSSSSGKGGQADASKLAGASQKGPYQKGSLVLAEEVRADGTIGAGSTSEETSDNRGRFSFNNLSWNGPTRLHIDGLYFDELDGVVSSEQRQLDAVVSASRVDNANINLYTHIMSGRILSLMNVGKDFDKAQAQAKDDWEEVTGISTPAYDLDLLTGSSGDKETDSAGLLLFSAAVLEEGLSQGDLDKMRDDFAEDGEINGSGESLYQDVLMAADANPGLLSDTRNNLEDEFGTEPPTADNDNIAWKPDGCELAKITDKRVWCGDGTFKGSYEHDNKKFVTFIPSIAGLYVVSLEADSSKDTPNAEKCYWQRYEQPDTSSHLDGDSPKSWSNSCSSEGTAGRPYAGSKTYIYPTVERISGAGQAWFMLSAYRITDGTIIRPMELPLNENVSGVVGRVIGRTDESYYTFTAGQGTHTIEVTDFKCSSGGAMRIELGDVEFSHSGWGGNIEKDWENNKCMQTIEADLTAGEQHYLRVENFLGGNNRVTPPISASETGGSVSYKVKISN